MTRLNLVFVTRARGPPQVWLFPYSTMEITSGEFAMLELRALDVRNQRIRELDHVAIRMLAVR